MSENLELERLREKVRAAVANYMWSEGCTCCRRDNHDQHAAELARLLHVPMYTDGSGYDFASFRK